MKKREPAPGNSDSRSSRRSEERVSIRIEPTAADHEMTSPSLQFFCEHAFTPAGWQSDVLITVHEGFITSVQPGSRIESGGEGILRLSGFVVPGLGNVHSHGFQRGLSGLTERGGSADDHFWSWREVMYRFLERLSPDEISALTAVAYMEMLEAGFTSVGEFHYVHHDPEGRAYASKAICAEAVVEAAVQTGIGLTLLPAYYRQGGFGGQPPSPGQKRFVCSLDAYEAIFAESRRALERLSDSCIGIAPHSLRAVSPDDLLRLLALHPDIPVHIHAAEQMQEVNDCLRVTGRRPVEWLLDHAAPGHRWCLIHCTHLDDTEIQRLAQSGAVAGLCPVTEANLGDGTFPAVQFQNSKGSFAVGTDSNVCISAAQELRGLEYSQRLRDQERNRLAGPSPSTGRHLFASASRGAERALGRKIGALAPGYRADLVVLDGQNPALMHKTVEEVFDAWIFGANSHAIRDVFVGGNQVVANGFHLKRNEILRNWRPDGRRDR
jgi:formimidoylglutamate deiminase